MAFEYITPILYISQAKEDFKMIKMNLFSQQPYAKSLLIPIAPFFPTYRLWTDSTKPDC